MNELARQGQETLSILRAGGYRAPGDRWVQLAQRLDGCRTRTCAYPPEQDVPRPGSPSRASAIAVENSSTLATARRLVDSGHHPVALNFASARHPGGRGLGMRGVYARVEFAILTHSRASRVFREFQVRLSS